MEQMRADMESLREQWSEIQARAASVYADAASLRQQINDLEERLIEAAKRGDAAHIESLSAQLHPLETIALHHSPPSVGMLVKGGPMYFAMQDIATGAEPHALVGSGAYKAAHRATIAALKSVIERVVKAQYTAQVSTETHRDRVPPNADYECLHDECVRVLDTDGHTWRAIESWELANDYLSRYGRKGKFDVQDEYLAWVNALKGKRTSDRHIERTLYGLCAVATVSEEAWLVYFKPTSHGDDNDRDDKRQ
ncbi:uncharacterized protein ACA1_324970 [Acanthamoeba castellanii str. Neff]|uniref:Uncharacterized protein n=1 Tax=Acanthamoeba castellanii (strain ATCC 30010 / Neff) TaxID=1257118 RepID=L8GH80_ACACF|nr:uncharacterized protein ACA1_324970 [Acanthamoeba castellanii str. Neff]ELR12450.1 hypothetical protein ACA1_324970 [Acanthamoeba castellanii str. Neff]